MHVLQSTVFCQWFFLCSSLFMQYIVIRGTHCALALRHVCVCFIVVHTREHKCKVSLYQRYYHMTLLYRAKMHTAILMAMIWHSTSTDCFTT